MRKGQIEIVVVAGFLLAGMLIIFLAAEAVSEQSVTTETKIQTQISVTEFKTLTAMNAALQLENPSLRRYVRNPEDVERDVLEQKLGTVFSRNNGASDSRSYYLNVEDREISLGEDTLVRKNVYIASPEGPKLVEVGAER